MRGNGIMLVTMELPYCDKQSGQSEHAVLCDQVGVIGPVSRYGKRDFTELHLLGFLLTEFVFRSVYDRR